MQDLAESPFFLQYAGDGPDSTVFGHQMEGWLAIAVRRNPRGSLQDRFHFAATIAGAYINQQAARSNLPVHELDGVFADPPRSALQAPDPVRYRDIFPGGFFQYPSLVRLTPALLSRTGRYAVASTTGCVCLRGQRKIVRVCLAPRCMSKVPAVLVALKQDQTKAVCHSSLLIAPCDRGYFLTRRCSAEQSRCCLF